MSEFKILLLLYSIGSQLKQIRDLPVYINPEKQGINTPCFFIQLIGSGNTREKEIGDNIYKYDLTIDISYLQDYTNCRLYEEYYELIEELDKQFSSINYINTDNEVVATMSIFDRKYITDISALHYQFRICQRVLLRDETYENIEKLKKLIMKLQFKGAVYGQVRKKYELNIG